MATMSMNTVIHRAVRRDLKRFAAAFATFPDGDARRAAALGRAWDNFRDQLTHHHEGEHEIAWPALQELGVDTATIDGFDAEHDAMAQALDAADAAVAALRASASAADAASATTAVEALRVATETHLDHEEAVVEPLFLEQHDSPVVKEMSKRFSRSLSLPEAGAFFAWLTDGAEAEEREALAGQVPKPVMAIIGGLFGRGYRKTVAPVWRA